MKPFLKFSILFLLAAFVALPAAPTRSLYFTTNTLSSGPSIEPGFQFRFVFSGLGHGKNGRIYVAVGNTDEETAGGDMCIAEYDPYSNTMKSLGTVVGAYKAAGNWVTGEYCNKVHTWFCGTPDGKVWFGSEDGGRGGHLLYVDPSTGKVVDHSRKQKYIYLSNPLAPVLNRTDLPPGGSNGVGVQDQSFKINQINPANPRYMWTESYGNLYLQVWDLAADTTRAFPGGHNDMRAFVVDREGSIYYGTGSGTVYRRTVHGQLSVAGSGIGYLPNSFVYSHSYDTAFTLHRIQGEVAIYDFVNKKAGLLADLPDGTHGHQDYRAMTISGDGKALYILGDRGNIYELTVATRQYRVIDNILPALAGDYAMSSGSMDTLGNWYIICTNWQTGPAYLLQVALGRDKITALPFPENVGIERRPAGPLLEGGMIVSPNPFDAAGGFRIRPPFQGRGPAAAFHFQLFSPTGALVHAGGFAGAAPVHSVGPGTLAAGRYLLRVADGGRKAAWEWIHAR